MKTALLFLLPVIAAAQITTFPNASASGNATTVNGGSVPPSQPCLGSNSGSQIIAGTGCGVPTLTNAHFFVGNSSNVAIDVAMSKDATVSNTGAVTVIGLNGTLLSGLATGILKNTTATGVPSIATAGTDYFNAASQITLGGALSGTANAAIVNPLSLFIGGWSNLVDPKQCDAVHAYCAAGSITTTTGSITTGTPTLTVASATGWTSGMGIGVAGAGAAAAELFTSVSSCGTGTSTPGTPCSSTAYTLAANASTTATTQIVNHDDTAAVLAAIASGFNIHVTKGNYNVRAATAANIFTISAPVMFIGDGSPNTVFYVRSLNNQIFAVRYFTDSHSILAGATISDIGVIQVGTSTAGAAFDVRTGGGANTYVTNLHIDRIATQNVCNALISDTGVISNWFTNSYIQMSTCGANGGGIWIDSVQPSGDWHIYGNEMSGLNTGIYITKSDLNSISDNKITGGQIHIAPSGGAGAVGRVFFSNNRIEGIGGSPTCGIQIDGGGSTAVSLKFTGGGVGGFNCGLSAALSPDLIVDGVHFYNIGGPAITLGAGSASITGNDLKSNAGAEAILLNSSAAAVITGNTVQTGPTNFVLTDASANKLYLGTNNTSLPNSIGAGTITNYSTLASLGVPTASVSGVGCAVGTAVGNGAVGTIPVTGTGASCAVTLTYPANSFTTGASCSQLVDFTSVVGALQSSTTTSTVVFAALAVTSGDTLRYGPCSSY